MFRPLSFTARAGILWTLLSVAGATAYATPVNYGDSYSQPPRWPKGVLKVHVQPDPKRQGRDTLDGAAEEAHRPLRPSAGAGRGLANQRCVCRRRTSNAEGYATTASSLTLF